MTYNTLDGTKGFIGNFYDGNYSLPFSYWGGFVIASFGAATLLLSILGVLASMATNLFTLVMMFSAGAAFMVYVWIVFVGTWRSASKYISKGYGTAFWGYLVYGILTLNLVSVLAEIGNILNY